MKVTAKIKLDLQSQNYGSSVGAVQGDGDTRCVEAALLDGGKPWSVPAGVTAAVAYKKPDYTKGLYDKLADGTPAVTVSGSTATVILAKQMLTAPGSVQACIVFNDEALNQLTTFPFTVAVAANPALGAEPSDDYIRLQWLEEKLDEYLEKFAGGATDEAIVQRIVDEYLAANPPTVTETDPTVPDWAKQAQKPTYTAAEVGALSAEALPAAINTALAQAKDSGEFDGKDGDPGVPGEDGYSPTASVTQTDTGAVITITDKTGTTTAALKNGADGEPGTTGATPNIQIGTVETLEAGSEATASIDGTPENPILNLGIPQGAPGSGEGGGISVTGATVGQTIRVAAVDDDGVPTAWEAVDFPSGGASSYQVLIDEDAIGNGANYVKCFDIPENANALFLFWSNVSGDVFLTSGDSDTINWSNRASLGNLSSNNALALLFRVGNYWNIIVYYGTVLRQGLSLTAGYKNLGIYFNTALTVDVYIRGGVLA